MWDESPKPTFSKAYRSLLLVNSRLRKEATPVLYSTMLFEVRGRVPVGVPATVLRHFRFLQSFSLGFVVGILTKFMPSLRVAHVDLWMIVFDVKRLRFFIERNGLDIRKTRDQRALTEEVRNRNSYMRIMDPQRVTMEVAKSLEYSAETFNETLRDQDEKVEEHELVLYRDKRVPKVIVEYEAPGTHINGGEAIVSSLILSRNYFY